MPNVGVPELLILLLIIAMLFGVGKLPQVFGAVGKGIREFRKETTGEDPVTKQPIVTTTPAAPVTTTPTITNGSSVSGETIVTTQTTVDQPK